MHLMRKFKGFVASRRQALLFGGIVTACAVAIGDMRPGGTTKEYDDHPERFHNGWLRISGAGMLTVTIFHQHGFPIRLRHRPPWFWRRANDRQLQQKTNRND
jgi:hypothetical protein